MKLKKIVITIFMSLYALIAGCAQHENESDRNGGNANSPEKFASPSGITATNEYGRGAKSDGQDTNRNEKPSRILTENADAIIIYFSRSGNTENLAKMIRNQTNADVLELTIANPYPENYEKSVERANQEREAGDFPEITTEFPDLSQYKRVYLQYRSSRCYGKMVS